MKNIEIKLTANKAPQVKALLKAQLHKAMEECAMLAESDTKILVPVDTGRLRRSYTHVSDSEKMTVGTNVDYGKYQELGTSRNRPQPHLRPAFENNVQQFKNIIERNLRT